MIMIIQMIMAAIALSPDIIPPRRKRRSLEGLSSYLEVITTSEQFQRAMSFIHRVFLAFLTMFLENSNSIGEIGNDATSSTHAISYSREPRFLFGFGSNDDNPPKPDPCKIKCCLTCCKKDKFLCIVQVILLIIIIFLLTILIILLVVLDFVTRKRRRRSVSTQKSKWISPAHNATIHYFYEDYYTSGFARGNGDSNYDNSMNEVVQNIRDALSSIVRTRNISIDLRHSPNKCQTCMQWSVFDLDYEYGPFLVRSAIPQMLVPFIL